MQTRIFAAFYAFESKTPSQTLHFISGCRDQMSLNTLKLFKNIPRIDQHSISCKDFPEFYTSVKKLTIFPEDAFLCVKNISFHPLNSQFFDDFPGEIRFSQIDFSFFG